MAPNKVILLACGSFNPPTNMHLRMFELARDTLNRLEQFSVIGGIISPVHDAYGKKELIPSTYRCEMVKLALKSSDWIQISDWECTQESWSRTKRVLQYHQNMLNAVLSNQNDSPNNNNNNHNNNINSNSRSDIENGYESISWITNDIRNTQGPVQIKLLCGADLLESFATPGLWADEDIETIIGQHGIVVITRQGTNPQRFIYESDMLTKYQHNITIVTEWITNDVSSTKVRRALRRQESVKYLIEDSVIEFIKKHGLYGTAVKNEFKYKTNLNEQLALPVNNFILTPSPSDVNMMSSSSSGHDIYLNLNPLLKTTTEHDSSQIKQSDSGLFQSTAEIKFSCKEELSQVVGDQVKTTKSPEKRKKVGVFECQGEEGEEKKKEIDVRGKLNRKFSEKHSKGGGIKKTESERGDKQSENLLLRRSKSDAIMSQKGGSEGETVSVKIQFTKDGIKVISDKESIV